MKPLVIPPNLHGPHFGMPSDAYHALPGVSGSMLVKYWRTTPAHAKVALEESWEPSAAAIIGTLAHQAVLEPDAEPDGVAIRPDTYPSEDGPKKWHGAAGYCKAWLAERRAEGIPVLTREEWERTQDSILAVLSNPDLGPLLYKGRSEVSVVLHHADSGSDLRGRIDWVPDGPDLLDLKFTADVTPRTFNRIVWERGYHIKAALYLDLWNAVAGESDPKTGFLLGAIESNRPHAVCVYRIPQDMLDLGRAAYERLAKLHADCVRANHWPAFPPGIVSLTAPPWGAEDTFGITELKEAA